MQDNVGLYRVNVTLASPRIGAPILELYLVVDAPTGEVFGRGEIIQTTTPPNNRLTVTDLRGSIHHTGIGKDERLVSLRGIAVQEGPPDEPISIELPVTVAMSVDAGWHGSGTFTFGRREVGGCVVTPQPTTADAVIAEPQPA